jgi:hypothetical protein
MLSEENAIYNQIVLFIIIMISMIQVTSEMNKFDDLYYLISKLEIMRV